MLQGALELLPVQEGSDIGGLATGTYPNAATCFCVKIFPFTGFKHFF